MARKIKQAGKSRQKRGKKMKNQTEIKREGEREREKMCALGSQLFLLYKEGEGKILSMATICRDQLIPTGFGGMSARKFWSTYSGAPPIPGKQPAGYRSFARAVALAKNQEKFARVAAGEPIDVVLATPPKPRTNESIESITEQAMRFAAKIKDLNVDPQTLEKIIKLLQTERIYKPVLVESGS